MPASARIAPGATDHERLALLYEVSQSLGSSLKLPTVLNQVMDAIIQLTGAERGYLVLADQVDGRLKMQVGRALDQETIDGDEMQVSRTVIRRVVESGVPVVTNNAQEDPRFSGTDSVISYALRSIMCAPLRVRGKTVGAAYVDSRVRSGVFSEEDLGMLAAFANQAAMAIENARLFTMTDQALAARVEELATLQQIDRDLNESLDFDRVMELTLEWAVRRAGADSGAVLLLNETEGLALVVASCGPDGTPDAVRLDHPVLAEARASKKTVLSSRPGQDESLDGTPAPAQLVVPVMREGAVLAFISLESRSDGQFDSEQQSFLERLADHAAIAIENSQLYDAVRAANAAKSTFISVVSHELRTPMTAIKGYGEILRAGEVGDLAPVQMECVEVICRSVDRMQVLVSDLSDINRLESGRLQLELAEVDLGEVVNEALTALRNNLRVKEQTVTVGIPADLPPVWADRMRVIQVVSNLVSNASKYSSAGKPITVAALRAHTDGRQMVQLVVSDEGFGISPEDQEKLFAQFFRSADPAVRSEAGWGLGLSIVKMLVEAQGGSIGVNSTPGQGSDFFFTLPVVSNDEQ